jgi:saccharopine dehydrogenase-like NADP-dependent oxidoreductase
MLKMSSSTEIKNVVLIGVCTVPAPCSTFSDIYHQASGNLGAIILPALLEAKVFRVTVLTRSSNTTTFPAGVTVIRTSYEKFALEEVMKGKDAIISAIGASGFQEQKVIIDAAIKAGVKRFIPSEFSTNTLSEAVRQLVPVFEPKKAILEYLMEKESTGLTWTGLSIGAMFDWVS